MTEMMTRTSAGTGEPVSILFRTERRSAIESVLDEASVRAGGQAGTAGGAGAPPAGPVLSLLDAALQRLAL